MLQHFSRQYLDICNLSRILREKQGVAAAVRTNAYYPDLGASENFRFKNNAPPAPHRLAATFEGRVPLEDHFSFRPVPQARAVTRDDFRVR